MEKRKVTIAIGGRVCSLYTDDPEEYISALEERANAVMKETAKFSGSSSYANAVFAVLSLTDQLLRMEQRENKQSMEEADRRQTGTPPKPGPKESRKTNKTPSGSDSGQVSVWDLLDEEGMQQHPGGKNAVRDIQPAV